MTICSDVILSAFRRARLRAANVVLDDVSAEIGLERLQGMYQKWSTGGLLGKIEDYYLSSGAYTPTENQRVYQASAASVITIPATITDAETGDTRAPKDGAIIIVVNPATNVSVTRIYNMASGEWQALESLDLADEAPLTSQFDAAIKDLLAIELLSETGVEPTKLLAANASLGKVAIASRRQTVRAVKKVFY